MTHTTVIGQPLSRIDGWRKVTGGAQYAAEFNAGPELAYGVIVSATIGNGRIAEIDSTEAEAAAGVLAVLTHRNAPRLAYRPHKGFGVDPLEGERLHILQDDHIHHQGQYIALAIADTFEHATHAASLVRVDYSEETAVTTFVAANVVPPDTAYRDWDRVGDDRRGDADAALTTAPVCVTGEYIIPRENHHPIELHATIAAWEHDTLTLWDKTQWPDNVRDEMAAVFGIPAANVRVISPFVGGAFGSGLRVWPHVTLAALAARYVGRPVKLVLTRRQMTTGVGYRPRTVQRIILGARHDGGLVAIRHECEAETSMYEQYTESVVNMTQYLYSCPNVATHYRTAAMNVSTPSFMRAPGEVSGSFALECAMDELAVAISMDPVELRLRNDTDHDEHRKLPFSSRALRECLMAGSERFEWGRRNPRPGSMHDVKGRVKGWGCAGATYPVYTFPASARAQLLGDGSALVSSACSDIGPGTYTSMTQVAAETLGLPIEQVRFELGDTRFPPAPAEGASALMGSVGSAVRAACAEARRIALARAGEKDSDDLGDVMRRLGEPIEAIGSINPGGEAPRYSMHSFGAVFAEVTVDPYTGMVRVARVVGAYGAGRVINPKLARSQAIGGIVMGIGMALMEHTALDERYGRVVGGTLADYLVPVHADIHDIDVIFLHENDPHINPIGAKGLAELTTVSVAASIANAVYHATGRRIRALPITPEKVLDVPES